MENSDKYFIKPIKGLEFVANDNSSFSNSILEDVKHKLYLIKTLEIDETCTIIPTNYQEDYVQAYRRNSFNLSDWTIIGYFINDVGDVENTVLISKFSSAEGFVFSLSKESIISLFYRGFNIQESENSPIVSSDLFLESLGCEITEDREFYIDYNDDIDFDESSLIEIQNSLKQSFEPNTKRKILNLGSTIIINDDEETNDEEINIEIEKPVFKGYKKSKIPNLGFSGTPRKPTKTKQEILSNSEFELPAFEARSTKKVANLGSSSPIKKKPEPKKQVIHEPKVKEIIIEKPNFVPNTQSQIINFDKVIKEENKNWSIIDIYKVKPNVYQGERSAINSKEFQSDVNSFKSVEKILSSIKHLNISNECVFVPHKLDNNNEAFNKINSFNAQNFKCLIILLDKEKPFKCVLYDGSLTLVVRLDNNIQVEVVSLNGVSLDDRALPYFTFDAILKMVN